MPVIKRPAVKPALPKKKRAAKRIAPKTLEKMKSKTQALKEQQKLAAEAKKKKLAEYKEANRQNKLLEKKYGKVIAKKIKTSRRKKADKKRFTPQTDISADGRLDAMKKITEKNIEAIKNRIKTIEKAYERLEQQRFHPDNANPNKGMTVKFLTEAKTKKQFAKRGYQEGLIMSEKQYNDLLRRNRLAHKTAVNELNRMEFLSTLQTQERKLITIPQEYKEAHNATINLLAEKLQKEKISGYALKRMMNVVNSSINNTIQQQEVLKITNGSGKLQNLHAEISGKMLFTSIKKMNSKNFNKILKQLETNTRFLDATIDKPNRERELSWFFKNL